MQGSKQALRKKSASNSILFRQEKSKAHGIWAGLKTSLTHKKPVAYLAIFGLVMLSIELCSHVFFTVFENRFAFFDPGHFVLLPETYEPLTKIYHPERGWDNQFRTPAGERPRVVSYGKPVMATFGDSFTYCQGVRHDETWQTYLADFLEMDVYNFGTPAYGPDQAVLKYLSGSSQIKAPVVALGLTTENINRIVNVYRPFYFLETGIPLTKPRYKLVNHELVLVENSVRRKEDIRFLGEPDFVEDLAQHDAWFNRNKHPMLRIPYSSILFNKRLWTEIYYKKRGRKIDDIDPQPWTDLWQDREARNLMFRILDLFAENVRANNAIPLFVLLPQPDEVVDKTSYGRLPESVYLILQYCAEKGYLCFDAISALARNVTSNEEVEQLFDDHVSSKGNWIIADELLKFLEKGIPNHVSPVSSIVAARTRAVNGFESHGELEFNLDSNADGIPERVFLKKNDNGEINKMFVRDGRTSEPLFELVFPDHLKLTRWRGFYDIDADGVFEPYFLDRNSSPVSFDPVSQEIEFYKDSEELVAVADWDNDGAAELVTFNRASGNVKVWGAAN